MSQSQLGHQTSWVIFNGKHNDMVSGIRDVKKRRLGFDLKSSMAETHLGVISNEFIQGLEIIHELEIELKISLKYHVASRQ